MLRVVRGLDIEEKTWHRPLAIIVEETGFLADVLKVIGARANGMGSNFLAVQNTIVRVNPRCLGMELKHGSSLEMDLAVLAGEKLVNIHGLVL